MPTITMTDDQAEIVVKALKRTRGHVMCDYAKVFSGEMYDPWDREEICERLDAEIGRIGAVRAVVEDSIEAQKRLNAVTEIGPDGRLQIDITIDGAVHSCCFDAQQAELLSALGRRF